MSKFVVAKNVISVHLNNKIFEKKDKMIFEESKGFKKDDLEAAFKAGFLDLKDGNKIISYKEYQKLNPEKQAKKDEENKIISASIKEKEKKLRNLEKEFENLEGKEKKKKDDEIKSLENEIIELKEKLK